MTDRFTAAAAPRVPRLTMYAVAEPGWRAALNRYRAPDGTSVVIGAAAVLGRCCLSLVWARPKFRRPR